MPVDFPRRALIEESDDVESYVARRSLGFTPADQIDQLITRPVRAARSLEPPPTIQQATNSSDPSPRPRRASFAEPLTIDADEEKSTAAEAGIGRRAIDPFPQPINAYAPRAEDAIPVQPQPAPLPPMSSPLESRAVPSAPSPKSPVLPSTPPAASPALPVTPARESRALPPPAPAAPRPVPQPAPVSRALPPMPPPAPRPMPAPPLGPAPASRPPTSKTAPPPLPSMPKAALASPPPPPPAQVSRATLKPAQLPGRNAQPQRMSPAGRPEARRAAVADQATDRPVPRQPHPTVRRTAEAAVRRTRPSRRAVDHEVPPIIVERLLKSYNGTLAVRDLSFVVQPGRVTGFLGPNGAGKTTTMRILVGMTSPTTGTATFGGLAYADLPHPQRTVGCVLDASFHPARTGRNHLRVLAATAGASDRRVDILLDEVGLGEVARQPAGEYSTGMRQRLALAAAMLGIPDYLILDEPANGLDPEGIRWLRTFLRDFTATGRSVLISSHLLNEIEATADDIIVINQGRLLAQMPMSELNIGEGTTRARVSDMRGAVDALAAIGADVQTAGDERGAFLRIHSHDVSEVGSVLFNSGIAVDELITERRDLEQEFFSMLDGSR